MGELTENFDDKHVYINTLIFKPSSSVLPLVSTDVALKAIGVQITIKMEDLL